MAYQCVSAGFAIISSHDILIKTSIFMVVPPYFSHSFPIFSSHIGPFKKTVGGPGRRALPGMAGAGRESKLALRNRGALPGQGWDFVVGHQLPVRDVDDFCRKNMAVCQNQ